MHELNDEALEKASDSVRLIVLGEFPSWDIAESAINSYHEALTTSDPDVLDSLPYAAAVIDEAGDPWVAMGAGDYRVWAFHGLSYMPNSRELADEFGPLRIVSFGEASGDAT